MTTANAAPSQDPNPALIAAQNDAFRRFACVDVPLERPIPGRLVLTHSVIAGGEHFARETIQAVGEFAGFEADNDPDGFHDFGAVDVRGCKVLWKIDLFEEGTDFRCGAETPEDPGRTVRVLTIMMASDC